MTYELAIKINFHQMFEATTMHFFQGIFQKVILHSEYRIKMNLVLSQQHQTPQPKFCYPNAGLLHCNENMVCGTLVKQNGTPPQDFKVFTI